jgi:sarcosine oxidase subunit gamma
MRTHKFAGHEIAQTSLARVNAIILRNDLATTPCFFILSDVTSTEYLWDALLDAMVEFEGSPVGIEALRILQAEPGCS